MRGVILSLFIFSLLPFILVRPYIGILTWIWLSFMNPHRLTYGFAYSFPWVELVAIVTMIGLVLNREKKSFPKNSLVILLSAFLLWTGITTIFAMVPDSAADQWMIFAKTMVMIFLSMYLCRDKTRINYLVFIIVVSLGFYGLKGGVFAILTGGISRVYGPPQSFIADNNDLALALTMVIPLMRYFQLQARHWITRWGIAGLMLLTTIAIVTTYSRAGFVALGIVALALIVKSRRRWSLLTLIFIASISLYHFVPQQWVDRMQTIAAAEHDTSFMGRVHSWEFATNIAMHRPIVGGGFRVYENNAAWTRYGPRDSISRAIHSIYFDVLGEQGFIGLILFLLILYVAIRNTAVIRKSTKHIQAHKWAYDLASMLQVSIAAFVVAGAAAPKAYFDLAYELFALTALVRAYVEENVLESSASGLAHWKGAFPVPRLFGNRHTAS